MTLHIPEAWKDRGRIMVLHAAMVSAPPGNVPYLSGEWGREKSRSAADT